MPKEYYMPPELIPEDILELATQFSAKKPANLIKRHNSEKLPRKLDIKLIAHLLYSWGWSPIICRGKAPLIKEWTKLGENHSADIISDQNIEWMLNQGADSLAIYLGDQITDIDIEIECLNEINNLISRYDFLKKAPLIKTHRGYRILVSCGDSQNSRKDHLWEVRTGKKCSHIYGDDYSFINNDIAENWCSPMMLPLVNYQQVEDFLFDLETEINGRQIITHDGHINSISGEEIDDELLSWLNTPNDETTSTTTSPTTTSGTTTSPEKEVVVEVVVETKQPQPPEAIQVETDLVVWRNNILSNEKLARQVFYNYGIELPENPGEYFLCPFHLESHPSVTWSFDGWTGRWVFHEYHNHTEETKFDLVECYAGFETGDLERFDAGNPAGKKDFNLWLSRMAIEFNQLPSQAIEVIRQIDMYKKYLWKLPILTEDSRDTLIKVMARIGREFIEGSCTGRQYAGISARYLADEIKIPVKKANQSLNYLCCLGIISKLPVKSSHTAKIPDRFVLNMGVTYEHINAVATLIGIKEINSFNQNLAAIKLGPQASTLIFRRQSAEYEANSILPSWHPENTAPTKIKDHGEEYLN